MMTILVSMFILAGAVFILIAALGVLRFRGLYSRIHVTTKATSFGLLLILIGVGLFFNDLVVYFKVFLVVIIIYLTAPLAAHSIAKSRKLQKKDKESDWL